MAKKPTKKELDALAEAQDLVYDAWEESTAKRRLALAGKALEISPLCADALSLMAGHAPPGSEERLQLLHRAVDAGRSALGSSFEELEGRFWGYLETRPYMRARHDLAMELWRRGRRDEAIDHLQDMLRLNPNDNQGSRYALLAWLAETDRHAEIAALEEAYSERMAMWLWPLVLAAYRRTGDSTETRLALVEAVRSNRHVAPLLLGWKRLPASLPDFYGIGDVNEAVLYVGDMGGGWSATKGALEWLAAQLPPPAARRGASRPAAKKRR